MLLTCAIIWSVQSAAFLSAQGLDVTLETLAGQSLRGKLESIAADGELRGNGWTEPLNLSLVSLIDFGRAVQPAAAGSVTLRLVGGGKAAISSPLIESEQLSFQATALSSGVALEAIAAIVWKENERVLEAVNTPLPDNDQVLVETADGTVVVAGLLEGLSAEKVQVNYQDKSRTIGLEKVLAIVPASLGKTSESKAANSTVRMAMQDGSLIVGELRQLDQEKWSVALPNGTLLEGPMATVSRIEIASDRQAFLSDLTPLESEQRVMFGQPREWTRDQSIDGSPLRLRRQVGVEPTVFRKGLGTRAMTRVVYSNEAGFTRLQAEVGLDPELGQQGDCEVLVRGDGIELWRQRLNSGKPADRIDLDIRGYGRLELVVLPGEQFDLGDFVNWANPRLLKLQQ